MSSFAPKSRPLAGQLDVSPIDMYAARIAIPGESAMIEDEVVREVRAAREAFAATHSYDIRAMVTALHELGVASGRELVQFEPRPAIATPNKPVQPTKATMPVSHDTQSPPAAPFADH